MTQTFTESQWEEHAKSNKLIFTSCKDCVFFSSPDKCSCGRLEKFEENNTEVFDVGTGENETPHKVVSGRVCNMFRTDNWSRALKIQDKPKDSLQEIAREEINIQCSFIVVCPDDEETRKMSDEKEIRSKSKEKISRIINTMKSIDSEEMPPKEVIILNQSWIQPYDFINYLRIQCQEYDIKCKWRLEHFSKENFETEVDESLENSFLKNVFKKVKTGYCAIFKESEIVPEKYLRKIDEFLNDDLKAFIILKPKEGTSGMFVNSILFKQFLNNKSNYTLDEFFEKIEKTLEEQKCKHLIQPLDKALKIQ